MPEAQVLLDELVHTRSPRSDASLLGDMAEDAVFALEEALRVRHQDRALTPRETELYELLCRES